MKKNLMKAIVAVTTVIAMPQVHAWTYSFTNHTDKNVAVGMKYQGINEPVEQRIVPANERRQFRPGDPDISSRKSGFVVDKFYYIKEPALSNWLSKNGGSFTRKNLDNAPWSAMSITWVPSEKYDAALELAEAVGNMTETVGKAAGRAAAAAATGGASEAAEAATELVKKGAIKADVLKEFADNDYSLGKFFGSIGKMIGYTMAKSRHMDIVEDENGNLKFLTLLSE